MRHLTAFLFCMVTLAATAQSWIDVTAYYLTNTTFDSSASGWTYTCSAGNSGVEYGIMEFWYGTFDIYQTVSDLPNGTYRIGVQSFYRVSTFATSYSLWRLGAESLNAILYANDTEQPIVSVFEWSRSSSSDGSWVSYSGKYYPNDRQATNIAFEESGYENSMEVEVTDGTLTIGIRCESGLDNNWCPFDNFTLEYYGEEIDVESISLSPSSVTLESGDTCQLTATLLPEDATYRGVTWSSSDESIATVSETGLVQGLGKGTALITATAKSDASISASCTVTVNRTEPTSDQLIINEIMVGNIDEFLDETTNFSGWIELYNPTSTSASLGLCYLSDDADSLTLWRMPLNIGVVPAGGYKVVWFDHSEQLNTNATFKLDMDGGTLYLSGSDGELITSLSYPAGIRHASYARTTDGGSTWSWTNYPTPGTTNDDAEEYCSTQLSAPEVDQPSQLFSGSLQVCISMPSNGSLVYTTDGSLPTWDNGKTSATGILNFTATTLLRCRMMEDGYLASDVVTRTYILQDEDYPLPILAVTGDNDYLYDDSIGIYVQGVNGIPGNGQSSACNWNQPWERPMHFSLLSTDGTMVFNQDVDMEIAGGWSRAWAPRSFKLKGSKVQSGDKKLQYPFFSAKPYINNRTLQIRNGGNDTSCRFIDPAIQTIIQTSGMDIDVQSYQPVHEFLNGEYIGVLNMREPNNKHYVYANYGWDDEEIDQFEMSPDSGYVQKCGDSEAFDYLVELSADAADEEVYAEIAQWLDLDEYINYQAAEFYLGSNDWTRNNVKGFRNRNDGKFRFVVFDTDASFSTSDVFNLFMSYETDYTFDLLYPSLTYITEDIKLVTLFRQLLQNDTFRRRFIDTFCIMGGSVFLSDRATDVIDSLINNVSDAMVIEGRTVTSSASSLKTNFASRNATMMSTLQNYSTFSLSDTEQQSVELSSDVDGARIEINGIDVPLGYFNGTLFQPVTLKAIAPAGYTFAGWMSSVDALQLFASTASWSYYDQGSLDGEDWIAADYDDSDWSTGNAPLGYGKDDITTTLDYGTSSSAKRPTYYFRLPLTLDSAPTNDPTLSFTVDDGFILYVNGTEAGRYNMPSGTVSYSDYATTYAPNNPDTGTLSIGADLFQAGENIIAVEVHNNAANSSDIYWAASLSVILDGDSYYSTNPEIELPEESIIQFVACYNALTESERDSLGLTPVRINEVSAANSVYISDYYKKSDWVELVNTTDEDIDLAGMYLSDNASKPTKYQISGGEAGVSTILPAHGHRIIWCDKNEPVSQLHADFKLAAEGGIVQITAEDQSWTDCLTYPAHDGNHTVGRYPDGCDSIYIMSTPTIDATNILTLYAESYVAETDTASTDDDDDDEEEIDAITSPLLATNNGLRIYRYADELIIRSEEPTTAQVYLFTPSGQCVLSTSVDLSNLRASIGLSPLPEGTYIARVRDREGTCCGLKFLLK